MSTAKPAFNSAGAAFTCTMASKTSGQGRRSAAVANSTNLDLDVDVFVSLTPGTITSPAAFFVYGYGSNDGTNFDTGGSTDADYNTIAGDEKLIGMVAILANSTARGGMFAFTSAPAFRSGLPYSFGIIISQTNCGTLSSTEGNHIKTYTRRQITIA